MSSGDDDAKHWSDMGKRIRELNPDRYFQIATLMREIVEAEEESAHMLACISNSAELPRARHLS